MKLSNSDKEATAARQRKECEILMRKVRGSMNTEWEFRRFLAYLAQRPASLSEAGETAYDERYGSSDLL